MSVNTTLKNILLPTDFSILAANSINTAVAICKRHNAVLHLLHVVEARFLIPPAEAHLATIYLVPELEKTGMESLTKTATRIERKHGIAIQTHIGFGNHADIIRKKAFETECELIVMGTHGASGFREFFIGTNAYSVIKNTEIPVLTIPGRRMIKDFKKILFPIRSVAGVKDKYEFIEPIIEKNNSELFIAGLSLPDEVYNKSDIENEISYLGTTLKLHDTVFKTEFYVCKNYAKKVLELAKKQKSDLIVINASLDYKWQQFFIAPYTQQVVNHAKVPVLSIRTSDNNSNSADVFEEELSNSNEMDLAF